MNKNKTKKGPGIRVAVTLVCIFLITASVLFVVYSGEVLLNKSSAASYKEIGKTEQQMLSMLNSYLNENNLKLDKPVAFVKDNGIMRGRAYVFNVPLTQNKLDFGFNGGVFSTEIILPDEYSFPAMYRCSAFAPSIGSLLFPSDFGTTELCGEKVYVVTFNESSLKDGSFLTLLDKVYGK